MSQSDRKRRITFHWEEVVEAIPRMVNMVKKFLQWLMFVGIAMLSNDLHCMLDKANPISHTASNTCLMQAVNRSANEIRNVNI